MKNLKLNKHLQAALQLSQKKLGHFLPAQTKKPEIQSMTAEVLSNEDRNSSTDGFDLGSSL